jgi:hypothetical protein
MNTLRCRSDYWFAPCPTASFIRGRKRPRVASQQQEQPISSDQIRGASLTLDVTQATASVRQRPNRHLATLLTGTIDMCVADTSESIFSEFRCANEP